MKKKYNNKKIFLGEIQNISSGINLLMKAVLYLFISYKIACINDGEGLETMLIFFSLEKEINISRIVIFYT